MDPAELFASKRAAAALMKDAVAKTSRPLSPPPTPPSPIKVPKRLAFKEALTKKVAELGSDGTRSRSSILCALLNDAMPVLTSDTTWSAEGLNPIGDGPMSCLKTTMSPSRRKRSVRFADPVYSVNLLDDADEDRRNPFVRIISKRRTRSEAEDPLTPPEQLISAPSEAEKPVDKQPSGSAVVAAADHLTWWAKTTPVSESSSLDTFLDQVDPDVEADRTSASSPERTATHLDLAQVSPPFSDAVPPSTATHAPPPPETTASLLERAWLNLPGAAKEKASVDPALVMSAQGRKDVLDDAKAVSPAAAGDPLVIVVDSPPRTPVSPAALRPWALPDDSPPMDEATLEDDSELESDSESTDDAYYEAVGSADCTSAALPTKRKAQDDADESDGKRRRRHAGFQLLPVIEIPATPTGSQYEAERVVDKRWVDGCPFYLVKWAHFSSEWNTWEPRGRLSCDALIRDFEENRSFAHS